MANAKIKIKRTTTSNAPSSLVSGELAYVEGTNRLYVGTDSDEALVIDGSIVTAKTATAASKISLKETNAAAANSLTLTVPDLTETYTLTLPATTPATGQEGLLVGSDGTMSYGPASAGNVSDIGDVDGVVDDDILLWDGTDTWQTVSLDTIKTLVGVLPTSDVTYKDVRVKNDLTVTGSSIVDATEVLTIQDKMIILGSDNISDANARGGGIVIPGADQKKLQWVNGTGWVLTGGDLKVESDDDTGTGISVGSSTDVIKMTVTTIVANNASPGDGEIKLEDAENLHNYNGELVNATINVGNVNAAYDVTGDITGTFDFGTFED
jgi:hypothetical protein